MKYQLKTITPVHIGTGETLSQIDGFYDNGRWHRIDLDAVLAAVPESELNRLTIAMGDATFSGKDTFRQINRQRLTRCLAPKTHGKPKSERQLSTRLVVR